MTPAVGTDSPEPITVLLRKMQEGDAAAGDQFTIAVYRELRRIAKRSMRGEREGHTLQTTGLLNEVYLRLFGNGPMEWKDSAHFYATAATLMRRILIDYARAKGAQRRGGGADHVGIDEQVLRAREKNLDRFLDLDRALEEFSKIDPRAAKVVELRFFVGFTEAETGHILGICAKTVKRDWEDAQYWLYDRLGEGYLARGASMSESAT